jgi:hypothetical protein
LQRVDIDHVVPEPSKLTRSLLLPLMSSLFRYFIPEDGDLEAQPNVFLAPKPRQQGYPPTLAQIKQAFPLPGRYHFRFKSPLVPGSDRDKGGLAVWMDCTDDRQPVPAWQSQIVAKVTRIGVEEEDDDDDDDEDFRRHDVAAASAATATPVQPPPPQQQKQQQQHPPPQQQQQRPPPQQQMHRTPAVAAAPAAPSFDLFDGPTHAPPAPQPASHTYSGSSGSTGSMGGLFDTHVTAPASSSSGNAALLDMNYHQHPVASTAHADFLGMTSAPSPPVSGNLGGFGMQQQQQQHQQQQQLQQQRPPPPQQQQQQPMRSNGSFESFGSKSQGGGGAFGDLGTPWK